ncbi:MAG: glutaredoxin [Acidothermus sp.]|nr:glutaredoxin [Acidothermus sp.]MCL6538411.1 glutaredoxin family protein [Acidothermus sp.]
MDHSPPPTKVVVVHAPACHFCEEAHSVLADLAGEFPIEVRSVEATDPEGEALFRRWRAPMYPLVLVDGTFFSFGRLPRNKLRALLAARYPAEARS